MDRATARVAAALALVLAASVSAGCLEDPSSPEVEGSEAEPPTSNDPATNATPSARVTHAGSFTTYANAPCPSESDPGRWCQVDTPGTDGTWNFTFFYVESTASDPAQANVSLTWDERFALTPQLNLTVWNWDDWEEQRVATYPVSRSGTSPMNATLTLEPSTTYRIQVYLPEGPRGKVDIEWTLAIEGPVEQIPVEDV